MHFLSDGRILTRWIEERNRPHPALSPRRGGTKGPISKVERLAAFDGATIAAEFF